MGATPLTAHQHYVRIHSASGMICPQLGDLAPSPTCNLLDVMTRLATNIGTAINDESTYARMKEGALCPIQPDGAVEKLRL